jgi:DNA-binding transcriptional MerR regulator
MQDRPGNDLWLTAAECASRTGLTVRALRVYERYDLVRPKRSASSWRLYGPAEITRLTEIIALKRLGLSLRHIAKLLAGHPTDIRTLLQMQKQSLLEKRDLLERALKSIGAMQDKLDTGASLSVDELLDLVKDTNMTDPSMNSISWRRYEQARPRTETKIDPTLYSDYEGHYRLEFGDGFVITQKDGRLFARVTGQNDVEAFPEAKDKFFLKVVPAQIVFRRDESGDVVGLALHQHGYEHNANRVDASVVSAIETQLAERIKNKIPVPQSEDLLRAAISQHQKGEIDYARMTPPLAQLAQEQREYIRADLAKRGALLDVSFLGVNQQGWDVYDVTFENGKVQWSFALTADGRFSGMLIRPAL